MIKQKPQIPLQPQLQILLPILTLMLPALLIQILMQIHQQTLSNHPQIIQDLIQKAMIKILTRVILNLTVIYRHTCKLQSVITKLCIM